MSAGSSFNIRSSVEQEAMSAIALEARGIVRAASEPVAPGETVMAQMNRAARNLGFAAGDWRVKAAWYGEAGCWGAAAFRDLQDRFEKWTARNERRASGRASAAAASLAALRQSLAATDPDFHREHILALDAALAGMGVDDRALGEAKMSGGAK
jgi:hypothetical protein